MSSTLTLILFLIMFSVIVIKCAHPRVYNNIKQHKAIYETLHPIILNNVHPKLGSVYNNPPQPLITHTTVGHIINLMGDNDGKIYIKTYAGMGNFFISKRNSLLSKIDIFYEAHDNMHEQSMYDEIEAFTKGYRYIATK